MSKRQSNKGKVRTFMACGGMLAVCTSLGVSYSAWTQESRIKAEVTMNKTVPSFKPCPRSIVGEDNPSLTLEIIPIDEEKNQEADTFNVPIEATTCEVLDGATKEPVAEFDINTVKIDEDTPSQEISVDLPLEEIKETMNQTGMVELTLKVNFKQTLEDNKEGGWQYPIETNVTVMLPEDKDVNLQALPSSNNQIEGDQAAVAENSSMTSASDSEATASSGTEVTNSTETTQSSGNESAVVTTTSESSAQ